MSHAANFDVLTLKNVGDHLKDSFIPHARNDYCPYALRHRALVLLSILSVLVKISGVILLTYGPTVPALSSAITSDNIISLTNESRKQGGLSTLSGNGVLAGAAQAKANDMAAKQYFAHTTPDGKSPWDFITAAGYRFIAAGENLAVDYRQAEEVESAWMNSPGHRANILNKDFKDIGIGIASGEFQGHPVTFVVQMFGAAPAPARAAAPVVKAPVPAPAPAKKPAPAPAKPKAKTVVKAQPKAVAKAPVPKKISLRAADSTFATANVKAATTEQAITNIEIKVEGSNALIAVETSADITRVVTTYNDKQQELKQENGVWSAGLSLSQVTNNRPVTVQAYNAQGLVSVEQAVNFAPTIQQSYDFTGVQSRLVNFFGTPVDPAKLEQIFYSLFIIAGLVILTLAIGVRHRVQHLSMIANTACVLILASVLWMAR